MTIIGCTHVARKPNLNGKLIMIKIHKLLSFITTMTYDTYAIKKLNLNTLIVIKTHKILFFIFYDIRHLRCEETNLNDTLIGEQIVIFLYIFHLLFLRQRQMTLMTQGNKT